jgi:hypothetical protein
MNSKFFRFLNYFLARIKNKYKIRIGTNGRSRLDVGINGRQKKKNIGIYKL